MARLPQNPLKIPPKVYGDLQIKNSTYGAHKQRVSGVCLSEMQQLFLCLKKYSFNEEPCSRELTNFKSCYNSQLIKFEAHQKEKLSGKSSVLEINNLLQKYPERKKFVGEMERIEEYQVRNINQGILPEVRYMGNTQQPWL